MEFIAGVDEAGRGPLAGPVVAAAVILPADQGLSGLTDSKKISPKKRAELYQYIFDHAYSVGIGIVNRDEIDHTNILVATHKAMYKALGNLHHIPDKALIDGYALPNQLIPSEGIVRGDELVPSISAASIIAKVTRDAIMKQYDIIFPEYSFAANKGYGTKMHIQTLEDEKASIVHRRSFSRVKENLPSIKWLKDNGKLGQWGERLAAMDLYSKGNTINALNVHCAPYGEIDIVAENETEIIFIEVKTAAGKTMGDIVERVDAHKLNRLNNAIEKYIADQKIQKDIRLDAYSISIVKGGPIMKHFKGIALE